MQYNSPPQTTGTDPPRRVEPGAGGRRHHAGAGCRGPPGRLDADTRVAGRGAGAGRGGGSRHQDAQPRY